MTDNISVLGLVYLIHISNYSSIPEAWSFAKLPLIPPKSHLEWTEISFNWSSKCNFYFRAGSTFSSKTCKLRTMSWSCLQLICYCRELVSGKKLKIILNDFMRFVCTRLILKDRIWYLTHPTLQIAKFTCRN